MKSRVLTICTLLLLGGCMTPEQKAAKQAMDYRPQLGVDLEPEWFSENAAMVRTVTPGSAAAAEGFQPLDKIVSFNGHSITNLPQLRDQEIHSQHGQQVAITVIRNGSPVYLTAELQ